MTIANAGMIAPLLIRALPSAADDDGLAGPGPHRSLAPHQPRCSFIDVAGLPIGTPLSAVYHDVEVAFNPGDTLIFLSDGIVEAHNTDDELFGFDRLEALVSVMPGHLSVAEVVQQILDAVLTFVGDAEPHDDITIIATRPAIRRTAKIDGDSDPAFQVATV